MMNLGRTNTVIEKCKECVDRNSEMLTKDDLVEFFKPLMIRRILVKYRKIDFPDNDFDVIINSDCCYNSDIQPGEETKNHTDTANESRKINKGENIYKKFETNTEIKATGYILDFTKIRSSSTLSIELQMSNQVIAKSGDINLYFLEPMKLIKCINDEEICITLRIRMIMRQRKINKRLIIF